MIYPIAICHYFISGNESRKKTIEKILMILQVVNTEDAINKNKIVYKRVKSEEKIEVLIYDVNAESSVVKMSIYSKNRPKHTLKQNRFTKIIIDRLVEGGVCHVYLFQKLIPKNNFFSKKTKLVEKLVLTGIKEACYLHILSTARLINLSDINFNIMDLKLDGEFESYGYDKFEKLKEDALKQKKFIDLIDLYPFQYIEENFIQISL